MKGQAKVGMLLVLLVVVLGAIFGLRSYNRLVVLREQIPAAWAQVENVLQRRNDLIPNLVNTVKGFAKQEQVIYGQISEALKSFNRATTVSEKIAADNSIAGLLKSILAVSLQYPALASNQNFQRLQDELSGTENRITVERMRFNEVVQAYNTMVKKFPTNLVAKAAGFSSSEDYFKAAVEAKSTPRVEF